MSARMETCLDGFRSPILSSINMCSFWHDQDAPWLIACEESGTVRDAFTNAGVAAVSCDLKPSRSPHGLHYQGDIRNVLYRPWAGVIAHPVCKYLTNSGVRWFTTPSKDPAVLWGDARWEALKAGAEFFRLFLDYADENPDVPVGVENPVMHKYAVALVGAKHDQTVQPFHFGDMQSKRTGWWLRNGLPKLVATNDVEAAMRLLPVKEYSSVHYCSPGANREQERSTFFPGMASAMALQWGRREGALHGQPVRLPGEGQRRRQLLAEQHAEAGRRRAAVGQGVCPR